MRVTILHVWCVICSYRNRAISQRLHPTLQQKNSLSQLRKLKKVQRKARSECYASHSPATVPRWLFQESTARKTPESYDNFWWTAEWILTGKHCWSGWQTTCYSLELITILPYSQRDTCPTVVGHRSVVDEGGRGYPINTHPPRARTATNPGPPLLKYFSLLFFCFGADFPP